MALVELEVRDGIAHVTLNRPDALNSLSQPLLGELDAAAARIEREGAIRAAIVTGAGRAFAAGADIAEIAQLDRETGLAFARRGQAVFARIERLEKPVVAAVNGFALGGGCELAMACHVRIASTRAKFGQPEVKLGILPGFGKNAHMIAVGGSREGTRIAHVLYEKISSQQMVPVLLGLLRAIRDENPAGLPAGEFLHRADPARLRALVGVEV